MEEHQQRPASRRFWEEGPAVGVAPISLSPPLQHQHRHRRDVNMSNNSSSVLDRPPALVSRVKISAAADGGGAGVNGDVKQGSSELSKLAFTVEDASYSCPDGPASSLGEAGKTSCWKGGAGDSWVLLRLTEKALLSFLRVRNRSTSEISISISVRGKRRRDFVKVKQGIGLAHAAVTDVKIGHLPCVYIRVDCRSRGTGGVSLHELAPVGIPARCVGLFMGPSMEDLTYKSTERLLFGPSLKTSLAPVCRRGALERLVLPPSFLRPEGASYDADDPDPVRKGPPSGTLGAHALLHRHHHEHRSPLVPPTPLPPPPGVGRGGGGGGGGGGGDRSVVHGRPFLSFPGDAGAGAATGASFFRGGGNFSGLRPRGGAGVGDEGGVVSFDDESSPASYAFAPQQGRRRQRQPSYSSSGSGSGRGSVRFAAARTGGGSGSGGGGGDGGRFSLASAGSHPLPGRWSHDERDEGNGDDNDNEEEETEEEEELEEEKGKGEDARDGDQHPRSRQPEGGTSGSGYRRGAGGLGSIPSYPVGRGSGGGSGSGSNFGSAYGGFLKGSASAGIGVGRERAGR